MPETSGSPEASTTIRWPAYLSRTSGQRRRAAATATARGSPSEGRQHLEVALAAQHHVGARGPPLLGSRQAVPAVGADADDGHGPLADSWSEAYVATAPDRGAPEYGVAEVRDRPAAMTGEVGARVPTTGPGKAIVGVDQEVRKTGLVCARNTSSGSLGGSRARTFPFSAVVGSDDLALALILTAVSPLSAACSCAARRAPPSRTMVRALAPLLPRRDRRRGLPVLLRPGRPGPGLSRRPAHVRRHRTRAPARLVELPVGRDRGPRHRVAAPRPRRWPTASRSTSPACWRRRTAACCTSTRSTCCTTTSSTCCSTLPPWAARPSSVTASRSAHASRFVLVGTMNPEEGELRPQLLDRFGLSVEVARPARTRTCASRWSGAGWPTRPTRSASAPASRRPSSARRAHRQGAGAAAGRGARRRGPARHRQGLRCLRGRRHARRHRHRPRRGRARGLGGRTDVTRADVRAAARLALPHRRRRNPFDAPGIDQDQLDDDARPGRRARARSGAGRTR